MGLRIQRTSSKKVQVLVTLFAAIALIAQPMTSVLQSVNANALAGVPDLSKIHFNGTKYVRENNATDIDAQLITYRATTDVDFYVDGNTDNPIAGVRKGASTAGYDEWRLLASLAAGEHIITARVEIGGEGYAVPQEGTVYSLDMPFVSYVFPTGQNDLFRPSDNPLQLKVDDEFDQFKDAFFDLYHYDTTSNTFGDSVGGFTITRDQCSQQVAGKYLLCDISRASGWKDLAAGTYAAKLKTRTQANNGVHIEDGQYWSHAFTIDDESPTITSFKSESGMTVGGKVQIAAAATDNNEVESVNLYLTRPGSDGVCTGNEAKLAESRVSSPDAADSQYRAGFDISGLGSGTYCASAIAQDGAMNNSNVASFAFNIDHTAPTVTMQSTGPANPVASTDPISLTGHVNGDFNSFTLTQDGVTIPVVVNTSGDWSYTIPKGDVVEGAYNFSVVAKDSYGNTSGTEALTVTVGPFVPGEGSTLPTDPVAPLAPVIIAPSPFTMGTTRPFTAAQSPTNTDRAVLGAEDTKDVKAQSSDLPVVVATANGWKFFGIAWYWWTLVVLVVAGGAWWTAASLRRREEQFA